MREETNKRFGYYPHDWQMQAAVKVLEGNDGIVIAGTGKGKTVIFALLGLAAELSKSNGHFIVISPLKALEGDQVCAELPPRDRTCLLTYREVERMEKAKIRAMALNEDTPWKEAATALESSKTHLIFASPEYLLRNPNMKKFYVNEESRARIFGVLVDEAHVIHEWATTFRKDYNELATLQVILGAKVPWWALSATFTDEILEKVYKGLKFGTSRSFWGIDAGVDRPNLSQHVYRMDSASSTYRSLIQFIPEGAETASAIPKTIIFFHSVQGTRDACLAIRSLLPKHLYHCVQPFAALDEESTKVKRLSDLRDGHVRVLCCTIAAGMGCDIPDIEAAVIYGVDSFVSFVQKGGRAGRDGKIEARMVWLVDDWMFEDSRQGKGKKAEDRRDKVDPMAKEYISRQEVGVCLREFMNRVFRPDPKSLGLPGFSDKSMRGLDFSWVVINDNLSPKEGECCTAASCWAPGSDSDTDMDSGSKVGSDLEAGPAPDTTKTSTDSRHLRILNVLRHETSAAAQILGPPLGRSGMRCSGEEKEIFRAALEQWRTDRWKSIRTTAPMLSKDWVLGKYNIEKLVRNTRFIINTPVEKIDRRWVRALIDTVSDDETVGELSSMIRKFHSGFFGRRNQRKSQASKRQKVSGSRLRQRPSSPAMSTSSEDSDPSSSYPPSEDENFNMGTPQGKRKRTGVSHNVVQASSSSVWL